MVTDVKEKYLCSVVITTHNRSALLYDSLISLSDQTLAHSQYEIIVIDNYSDDGGDASSEVCNRIKNKYPQLNITFLTEATIGGVTFSRNRAMTIAEAPIVFFGDDDYIADQSLLEAGLSNFNDNDVAIVVGPLLPVYESPPPPWVEHLWVQHPLGEYLTDFTLINFGDQITDIAPQFAFWSNWAVRKIIFEKSPGFGPDGFGGKYVKYNGNGEHMLNNYVHQLGGKILYCPKMKASHRIQNYRFTDAYFKSRYFYYGIGESFEITRVEGKKVSHVTILIFSFRSLASLIKETLTLPSPIRYRKYWKWRGFIFHQRELRRDTNLMNFCLLKTWKNYNFHALNKIETKTPSLW